MRPILWMSDPLARTLREWFPGEVTVPGAAEELLDAPPGSAPVVFVDGSTLAELDRAAKQRGIPVSELTLCGPVIAMCDGPLQPAIPWLADRPWLSHVMCASLLEHAIAPVHVENVVSTLAAGGRARLLDWVRSSMQGRRIWLTQASECTERLDRMGEFFESKAVGASTIARLRHAAGELLATAFYDAPLAAGALTHPIARSVDVALPEDTAAGLVYGCTEELALVHVRDPFGALARGRMFDRTGDGWWQLLAASTFGAISVVRHHHTDYMIAIAKQDNVEPRPLAFHLFSKDGAKRRFWKLLQDESIPLTSATFITSVSNVGEREA